MKKTKDNLGDRMKKYEVINRGFLIPKLHTIIRLDGKAFHTYTKQFKRPFDDVLINAMNETAKYLCEHIQGAKFAYVQSDEISIYLSDQDSYEQQLWYGGNIQKIVSVAASMASSKFNHIMFLYNMEKYRDKNAYLTSFTEGGIDKLESIKLAEFDARVFQVPNKDEVINCFIWRQQDAIRNSISAIAQYHFSPTQLHKKSTKDMLVMLETKNDPWENYDLGKRNGRFISKNLYINDIQVCKRGVDDDNCECIWYQPENVGLYESKHGRALQWSETHNSGFPDWCDIKIEKIRSNWDIVGADNFIENRKIITTYFK